MSWGHRRGSRGIASSVLFFNLGARWRWVVNTMPSPLYLQEWPGTHCLGGWVGPRAVQMGAENLASNRIWSPNCPTSNKSLHWLHYPSPLWKHTCRITEECLQKSYALTNFLLRFTGANSMFCELTLFCLDSLIFFLKIMHISLIWVGLFLYTQHNLNTLNM